MVVRILALLVLVFCVSAEDVGDRRHITRLRGSVRAPHIIRAAAERYERELRGLDRRSDTCRELFEPCRGYPRCCGELQCYWEDGFSALRDGQCVSCVDRTLTCQRDAQCCENTVCQKDDPWNVDGVCELRHTSGTECYRDAQCQSGNCDKNWYEVHGVCL